MLRWHQVDLLEGIITVGKSKTEGGEGRLVYLSDLAVQTLKGWRSQFPDVQPSHAVFPRESYGLRGKKGSFGGAVVPYRTFPDQPVSSFATSWQAAKKAAGIECRWHDLRHSAAYRLARDPLVPLTDVQWVLGHARLETTQLYVAPSAEDVIASVRAHYARGAAEVPVPGAPEYRAESLAILLKRPAR